MFFWEIEDKKKSLWGFLTFIKSPKITSVKYQLYIRFFTVRSIFVLLYLVRGINPPNNQFCFPHFIFEFFSVWAVEKITKFLLVQNRFFSQFWPNEKFVFFFNCSTEKILRKKLGKTWFVVLVFRCHELITSLWPYIWYFSAILSLFSGIFQMNHSSLSGVKLGWQLADLTICTYSVKL